MNPDYVYAGLVGWMSAVAFRLAADIALGRLDRRRARKRQAARAAERKRLEALVNQHHEAGNEGAAIMTEPTYTADQAAAILGMNLDDFAASVTEVLPELLADGTAHYEADGTLVINGGDS